MSVPATALGNGRGSQPAPYVVIPHAHGYTVYAADAPSDAHQVTGSPDNPGCTCPDFRAHPAHLRYRCPHIYAVFRDVGNGSAVTPVAAPVVPPVSAGNGFPIGLGEGVGMVLKRSVSPDRRIDSLSVELTIPPDVLADKDIDEVAMAVLHRQDAIVTAFLDSRENSRGQVEAKPSTQQQRQATNGANEAVLRDVGGMQTRWGWRYFINVAVGEKMYKLFGTRKQLAEQLMAAGCAFHANNITKGAVFNAKCLAVLTPSEDGKYTNVESILPWMPESNGNGR
jgi:hypothetical protein